MNHTGDLAAGKAYIVLIIEHIGVECSAEQAYPIHIGGFLGQWMACPLTCYQLRALASLSALEMARCLTGQVAELLPTRCKIFGFQQNFQHYQRLCQGSF